MKKLLLAILALALPAAFPQAPPGAEAIRFQALDVLVDAGGKPLAAWQIEIVSSDPRSRIAGVEGGETAHFARAPYYDPAALQGGRIIIAAFTVDEGPPAGRTRVARIHMAEPGDGAPEYSARLMAAAREGGERIEARAELVPIGGER